MCRRRDSPTLAKAGQPVGELFQKRNVRSVEMGNDLYPTEWRAKRFGISLDDLTKAFWAGSEYRLFRRSSYWRKSEDDYGGRKRTSHHQP